MIYVIFDRGAKMSLQVWEDEKYRIEVQDKRSCAIEKKTGLELANTICLGDNENTINIMKKFIIFHELGNPKT